jgi:hypothetical protein
VNPEASPQRGSCRKPYSSVHALIDALSEASLYPVQVAEDPTAWVETQPVWTYLPCLSTSYPGCVAVLVSIGHSRAEYVRMQTPLEDADEGAYKVKYQLGEEEGEVGASSGEVLVAAWFGG